MDKIVVDGHPDLYRDSNSGAIINKNSNEYESYINSYKKRLNEKERLHNVETDLNDLKGEINEIKKLLTQLVNK
jgi:sugar-specific transcriptional regulator TrmB